MSIFGIVIDIIIVALLLIFGLIGLKKGFLKSFISLFSWIVCLVIACFVAKYVAGWINGIYDFSSLISKNAAKGLLNTNEFFAKSLSAFESKQDIISSIPNSVNGLLKTVIKVIFNNANVDMTSSDSIANIVGISVGDISMVIISGVLVFIVLKIVVAILSKIFDNISRTKILGGLNKILGLVFGLIKAGCIIILFNCLLVGLSLIPVVNKTINPIIQNHTCVEKFIYNQTDKIVGKYVIEGNMIQTWVTNLWNSR